MEEINNFWIKAINSAKDISLISNTECSVITKEGKRLIYQHEKVFENFNQACRICQLIENITGEKKSCEKMHRHNSDQAYLFGGRYINLCSISLLHITSPLICNNKHIGSISAGPALLISPEELIDELIQKKFTYTKLSDENRSKLLNIANTIPQISTLKSTAFSRQLLALAEQLSGEQSLSSQNREQTLQQQSKISEYIHQFKEEGFIEPGGYPLQIEQRMLGSLQRGETQEAKKLLNQLLAAIQVNFSKNYAIHLARFKELATLIARATINGGGKSSEILNINQRILSESDRHRTIESLSYRLQEHLEECSKKIQLVKESPHSATIKKAVHYILDNLANKITLQMTAEEVCLSPSYFCSIFKQEKEESFKSFLNRTRIEKAKELLSHSDLSLIDISGITGFEDQSYFSKIFKKFTDSTPAKYRQKAVIKEIDTREIHD